MNRSLLLRYRRLRRVIAAVLLFAAAGGAPAAARPGEPTPGAGTELAAHSDAAGLPTAAILVSLSASTAAAALERGGAPPFSRAKQCADPDRPSDVLRAGACAGVLRPRDPAPGHRHALHFLHAARDGRYTSTSPPIPG